MKMKEFNFSLRKKPLIIDLAVRNCQTCDNCTPKKLVAEIKACDNRTCSVNVAYDRTPFMARLFMSVQIPYSSYLTGFRTRTTYLDWVP